MDSPEESYLLVELCIGDYRSVPGKPHAVEGCALLGCDWPTSPR